MELLGDVVFHDLLAPVLGALNRVNLFEGERVARGTMPNFGNDSTSVILVDVQRELPDLLRLEMRHDSLLREG